MPGIIGTIQAAGLASWGYPEPLEGPVIPVSNLYQTSSFGTAVITAGWDLKNKYLGKQVPRRFDTPCIGAPPALYLTSITEWVQ